MRVSFESAKMEGEYLYFWNRMFNVLCRLNSESMQCEYVATDERYPIMTKRLYGSAEQVKSLVFFPPLSPDHYLVLDLNDNTVDYYAINVNEFIHTDSNYKFMTAQATDDYVCFVGTACACIVRVDVKTKKYTIFNDWSNEFRYSIFNNKDLFGSSLISEENTIIAPACYENKILEFNVSTGGWKVHSVPDYKKGFSGICFDGRYYWLLPSEDNIIIKWDKICNSFHRIELPLNKGLNEIQYGGCVYFADKVMVQKAWKKEVLVIGEEDHEFRTLVFSDKNETKLVESYRPLSLIKLNDSRMLISDCSTGDLFEISADDLFMINKMEYKMSSLDNLDQGFNWSEECILEDELFNVELFVDKIIGC